MRAWLDAAAPFGGHGALNDGPLAAAAAAASPGQRGARCGRAEAISTPAAPAATAFIAALGPQLRAPPPIDCEGGGGRGREIMEVLQLRAAGERAQGRVPGGEDDLGSPAEEELERRLAQEADAARGVGGAASASARRPDRASEPVIPKVSLQAKVTAESACQVEKVWSPKPLRAKQRKGAAKAGPPLHGPALPSRHELLFEGPFPLEKRLGELASHAYYLWGDARFVAGLAGGSRAEARARALERFAKHAESAGRDLLEAAHIPVARTPPYLPLSVSMSPTLVWGATPDIVELAGIAARTPGAVIAGPPAGARGCSRHSEHRGGRPELPLGPQCFL